MPSSKVRRQAALRQLEFQAAIAALTAVSALDTREAFQFVVIVVPRACKVALSVTPWPVGALDVPPDTFKILPEPQSVVPLVPSSETSSAKILLTLAAVNAWLEMFIEADIAFVMPGVPKITF